MGIHDDSILGEAVRRAAEEAVRQSERELADFFDNASVGLHWVGPDGTVLRVNRAELEMLGYEPHEMVGRPIADFHADRSTIDDILARLARDETLRDYPARLRARDGSIREVLISSSAYVENGRFVHSRCFTVDVTARRRAEEAQRLLAAIVSTSSDAIVSKNLDGIILSWNEGAERLFGYEASEAVGQSINLIIPPHLLDEERSLLERLRRGERIQAFETVRVAKGGRRLDISVAISPVRDERGRIVGASKVARDIGERKATEARVRRLADELRLVTDAVPALISYVDAQGRYRLNNQAYADWFGRSREAYIGKHLREVLGEEAYQRIRPHAEAALAGQRVEYEDEIPYRSGGTRHIRAHYVPDVLPDGRVNGFFALITDITAKKRTEEALRTADRRKDEFLATLAHELRNPLAPIRNALETLKHADDGEVAARARGVIERQVGHMVRLVDDLLDVSRITRDQLELRRATVDLSGVIRQAVETSAPLADCRRQRLEVVPADPPLFVDGDPVRLAQVFSNLLNNGCHYSPAGATVTITAVREGDEAVVRVRDTGVGIAASALETVFEMFAQVGERSTRTHAGLGIGLTLVKRLVELHGGRVVARSDGPGRGSEFEVRLPAVAAPSPDTAEPVPAASRSTVRRRVLVVDDNQDSAESMAMLLSLQGHEVRQAFDGIEAVAAAEHFRPDLVLLDIGLPLLNGYEACRRIRQLPGGDRMVLVALTGWGQEEERQKSREAGFDRHVVKPADYDVLMELLESQPQA